MNIKLKTKVCSLSFLLALSNLGFADAESLVKYKNVLNYVKKIGEDVYCYWDIKKEQHNVNWDLIIQHANSQLNENTTKTEFQKILTEVASSHQRWACELYK